MPTTDTEQVQPDRPEPTMNEKEFVEPIAQFFHYAHLPPTLQAVSRPFSELALLMVTTLPRNPERTVALRFLLSAKDAAVRAALYK